MRDHPYDSRQIANYFIRLANKNGQSVSVMYILKLTYMAHGWTLALYNRPLVNDHFEAWKFGPVVPTLYYAFRPYGIYNIKPLAIHEVKLGDEIEALLTRVYDLYKGLSASQLSKLTHIKDGPWDCIYRTGKKFDVIPDKLIAAHYKDKLKRLADG